MAKCLRCGNTFHFNMWCSIQKVLEVELNDHEEVVEVIGEPEDKTLQGLEDVELMEADLTFSMVSCAWCGSKAIEVNGKGEILSLRIHQ
jgi:succinate dehydrogenase/fumarate reductase-like Fe-S protein